MDTPEEKVEFEVEASEDETTKRNREIVKARIEQHKPWKAAVLKAYRNAAPGTHWTPLGLAKDTGLTEQEACIGWQDLADEKKVPNRDLLKP